MNAAAYSLLGQILEKSVEEIKKEVLKSAAIAAAGDGVVSVAGGERSPVEIAKDIGCGAFSGAAGTAAKAAFEHYKGAAGTKGTLVGVMASLAARSVYRRALPRKKRVETDDED